jgi:hypothetical protein
MTVPAADNLRHFHSPAYTPRLWSELLGAGAAAAELLEAIDALHQPYTSIVDGAVWCSRDREPWPCTEHRLLHPNADGGG